MLDGVAIEFLNHADVVLVVTNSNDARGVMNAENFENLANASTLVGAFAASFDDEVH